MLANLHCKSQCLMEIIVDYMSGKACFRIFREKPGIYSATLVYYEGERKLKIPTEITLVRGVRQWTASHDDEILISELGRRIEESVESSISEDRDAAK